ncbi:MAG: LpqB family beta-propeller domain-containing protein [Anaerolineaceae bacterium]|jgi:Tol biopolymer transport system component|nr:LpqB family beta-propeller domain-containing protein [Anaerolineaceae bacterium]
MKRKMLHPSLLLVLTLLIASCKTGSPDCKEMLLTHHFVSRKGFESNIVAICPEETSPRRVTTDGLYNTMPHWSPDGSRIAYLSARSGTLQLHLMDPDGGNDRQLTSGFGLDVSQLVWLPDGNRIAMWAAGTGEWQWQAVDVVTGEITSLDEWALPSDSFLSMSLSHDGTRLAYVEQTTPKQQNTPYQLYIQDIDGSNRYALTNASGIIHNPIWSPDDSQIAFLSCDESAACKENVIYMINLDGSNLHELTTTDLYPSMITWSPDGESLAVIADDELYTGGVLYQLDLKTGKRTALFKLEQPSHLSHLSWSH